MKEITIKLTDKEYSQYVKKGQSEYHMHIKKAIEDDENAKKRLYRKYLARVFSPGFAGPKSIGLYLSQVDGDQEFQCSRKDKVV